ncbi:fumarylacetoacetate hydrolase family protein [Isoptericola sp. NPDC055881]
MKFARLGPAGAEIPVLQTDGASYDLRPLTADVDGRFLASDGPRSAAALLAAGHLQELDTTGLRRGAPIARPGTVMCIGMNYAAHAAESGAEPPQEPVLFYKPSNTVVGPDDPVTIPRGSEKTDWEVELGVVIGSTASYLSSPDESMAHVAGFVVANDLSERDWQLGRPGGQWGKGKSAAGFTPVGPTLVTPDEVDHRDLRLRSWVNGEPRQDSSTADLIFGVEVLVHHLSQYLVLEPGDLLLTGTPEGVALSGRFPYLRAGDRCELEIEGLGRQHQSFVA